MDFLMQLWQGLVEVWRRLDYSGRTTVIASGLLAAAAVIGLSMWSARPEYRMLFTDLASEHADAIIADLDTRNVEYRLRDGGSTILVPSDRVYSLRNQISQAGMAPSGQVRGWEIFDRPTLGMTKFMQNINAQRARAGQLARTIEELDAVRRAVVSLAIPEERLLATEEGEPSAAIVLRLAHAGALDQKQIRGIRNLVSSSVPNLRPGRITIVDTDGAMLARPIEAKDSLAGASSLQLEIIAAEENRLQKKVETVLTPLFANFSVAVSIAMNFDRKETTTKVYDPDGAVVVSEQTITETVETEETTLAPGTISGLGDEYTSPPTRIITNKEDTTTNYEVSVTDMRMTQAAGAVSNIMVTAVVEPPEAGAEGGAAPSRPADELVRQMIANAAGIDQAQAETQVTLITASFAEAAALVAPPAPPGMAMQRVLEFAQGQVLPIALIIVALVLVRSMLRRGLAAVPVREAIPAPEDEVSAQVAMRRRVQEEVERLSAEQPKILASLLKTWLAAE